MVDRLKGELSPTETSVVLSLAQTRGRVVGPSLNLNIVSVGTREFLNNMSVATPTPFGPKADRTSMGVAFYPIGVGPVSTPVLFKTCFLFLIRNPIQQPPRCPTPLPPLVTVVIMAIKLELLVPKLAPLPLI